MFTCVRVITIAAVAAGLTCSMLAQEKKTTDGTKVAGKWTVSVKGSPHGDTTMGLVLQQDGEKVKGIFASPHGEHPVEGTFTDGTLKFATTAKASGDDNAPQITFTAKLKDDDTLAGFLSSEMGDMTWTAQRVKDRK